MRLTNFVTAIALLLTSTHAWAALSEADRSTVESKRNYIVNGGVESSSAGFKNYSNVKTGTVTIAAPGVWTVTAHGLAVGDPVTFSTTGALPTGLTAGTTYYVSTVTDANTFRVATSLGGSDLTTTGSQSGTHSLRPLTPTGIVTTAGNLTVASSTSSPLAGNASLLVSKDAANRAGEGFYNNFSVDRNALGQPVSVGFSYEVASGTYDVGSDTTNPDLTAWVYGPTDGTATLKQLTNFKIVGAQTGNMMRFSGQFQTAMSGVAYRLLIHENKTGTSAYGVKFDNFRATVAGKAVDGGAVAAIISGTPPASYTGGTPIIFPTVTKDTHGGYSASTGKYTIPVSGYYRVSASIDTNVTTGNMSAYLDAAAITPILGTGGASGRVLGTVSFYANAGQLLDIRHSVSYTGSGAGGFNLERITGSFGAAEEARTVAMRATGYGTSLAYNTTTAVAWTTTTTDTHGAFNGTTYTVPVPGLYRVTTRMNTTTSAAAATGRLFEAAIRKNGSDAVYGTIDWAYSTTSREYSSLASGLLQLVAGDTLTAGSFNNLTGSSISAHGGGAVENYFTVERLSGPNANDSAVPTVAFFARPGNTFSNVGGLGSSLANVTVATKELDTHNAFNTTTGVYTVPVPGIYETIVHLDFQGARVSGTQYVESLTVYKNSTSLDAPEWSFTQGSTATTRIPMTGVGLARYNAGDTISVQSRSSVPSPAYDNCSYSIKRIGN